MKNVSMDEKLYIERGRWRMYWKKWEQKIVRDDIMYPPYLLFNKFIMRRETLSRLTAVGVELNNQTVLDTIHWK